MALGPSQSQLYRQAACSRAQRLHPVRRQGVHGDARQGTRRARLFRPAAADHDAVGGGARRRRVASDRPAHPAHAGRARLCRTARPPVFALAQHPAARLCLSRHPELDRPRRSADEGAERARARIMFGLDPAGDRDRLCGARADQADHVGGGVGGEPPAGLPYRHGPCSARLSRRCRDSGAGSNPSASSR